MDEMLDLESISEETQAATGSLNLVEKEQTLLQSLSKQSLQTMITVFSQLGIRRWRQPADVYQAPIIFLQWSRRYNLPLNQVISTITAQARKLFGRTGQTLGFLVPLLTSNSARLWLEQTLGDMNQIKPIKLPSDSIMSLMSVSDPVEYCEVVNSLRQWRREATNKLKVYRGTPNWRLPNRTDDAILRYFGY